MSAVKTARSLGVRQRSFLSVRTGARRSYGLRQGTVVRSAKAVGVTNACLMVFSVEKASPFTASGVEVDSFWGYQLGVETN